MLELPVCVVIGYWPVGDIWRNAFEQYNLAEKSQLALYT